jgi:hypothetical protein
MGAAIAVSGVQLATVVAATSNASASSVYYYQPGHPMMFGEPNNTDNYCTGGYVIRGLSGTFLTTAGSCASRGGGVGATVYGTVRAFGTVSYSKWPTYDSELVSETPPDDAYQTIAVDPTTHQAPGGSGKVVGIIPNSQLTTGFLVGKMGVETGWTEGAIIEKIKWYGGMTAYCSAAQTEPGDVGGPVWRAAIGGGVDAVGEMVYSWPHPTRNNPYKAWGCFLSIADLLTLWGAWLPVWPSP